MAMVRSAIMAGMAVGVLCGTAVHGESGWNVLLEDCHAIYLAKHDAAVPDASGRKIVQLKRVFKGDAEKEAYSLDTVEIYCRKGVYRFTEIVIYDKDDDVLHRYRLNDQLCPIPPSSFLDRARSLACP